MPFYPAAAAPHNADMPSSRGTWRSFKGPGCPLSIKSSQNRAMNGWCSPSHGHTNPNWAVTLQNLASLPGCTTTLGAISSCFPAFKPQNHCPPTSNGNGGQSPSKIIPFACDCKILSGGSFMSPTAFCWQVVLPGNLQWGEEGNSASGTNCTPNWVGGPLKPIQQSNTAAACPAAGMAPCRHPLQHTPASP